MTQMKVNTNIYKHFNLLFSHDSDRNGYSTLYNEILFSGDIQYDHLPSGMSEHISTCLKVHVEVPKNDCIYRFSYTIFQFIQNMRIVY